jgi:hypothetical protein
MNISKQQMQTIISNAPKGVDTDKIQAMYISKGYNIEGVDSAKAQAYISQKYPELAPKPAPIATTKTMSLLDRGTEAVGDVTGVISDIRDSSTRRSQNIDAAQQRFNTGEQGLASTVLQTGGQLAGAGADAIGAAFKGAANLAFSDKTEKDITDVISKYGAKVMAVPQVQEIINKYNNLTPEEQSNIDAVGGILSLVGEFVGTGAATKAASATVRGTKQAGTEIADAIGDVSTQTFQAVKKILPKSENIMNKVARLTPTQARKFEQLTGKTHGQYLKDTGNFGTPDEIIEREYEKFAQSLKSVDDTLAQLDGNFTDGIIDDVLNELHEKAVATSTKNVKSPYLDRVNELIAKNTDSGLSMSEINELKRLYEINVKLGYNKLVDAEKIQRSTNLDNALREWQVSKAEELGFENLRELNKQTQASKQLINSLGDQVIGKTGLNDVTLTDWIMLSGGDPTAVVGLLTKKFFSSKKVQAKIAQWLNDAEVSPIVNPKVKGNYIYQANTATTTINTTKNNIPTTVPKTTAPVNPKGNVMGGYLNIGGEVKDVSRLVEKGNPYSKAAAYLDTPDRSLINLFIDKVSKKLPISKVESDALDNLIELMNKEHKASGFYINPNGTDLSKVKQLSLLLDADRTLTSKAIGKYDANIPRSPKSMKGNINFGAMADDIKGAGKKSADNLLSEAKKYKSADDFWLNMNRDTRDSLYKMDIRSPDAIKSYWNNLNIKPITEKAKNIKNSWNGDKLDMTIYHGGDDRFIQSLNSGKGFKPDAKRDTGTGGNLYGLSTSTNYNMAKDFSTSATSNPSVGKFKIDRNARVFGLKGQALDDLSVADIKKIAKEYDVIVDMDNTGGEYEIRVLNPKVLKPNPN